MRDPRWGRNIETPGEDPYLTSQYAINFVSGFQSNPIDPDHIQASAACKHYIANELEKWNNTDRNHFDAKVTIQVQFAQHICPDPYNSRVRWESNQDLMVSGSVGS